MILLALLLLLAAVALALFMVFGISSDAVSVAIDGLGLSLNTAPLTIYLLGALTMLLTGLAWAMMRAGSRRKLDRRRELKRLRQVEKEQSSYSSAPSQVDLRNSSTSDPMYADPDRRV